MMMLKCILDLEDIANSVYYERPSSYINFKQSPQDPVLLSTKHKHTAFE